MDIEDIQCIILDYGKQCYNSLVRVNKQWNRVCKRNLNKYLKIEDKKDIYFNNVCIFSHDLEIDTTQSLMSPFNPSMVTCYTRIQKKKYYVRIMYQEGCYRYMNVFYGRGLISRKQDKELYDIIKIRINAFYKMLSMQYQVPISKNKKNNKCIIN